MAWFDPKYERERQERETPERIMSVAHQKGSFNVSLRYRDEWLHRRCKKLQREGLLVGGKRVRDQFVFYPAQEPPTGRE